MRRATLVVFGLWGVLALSCQVLPEASNSPVPPLYESGDLPPVSDAPAPAVSLAGTPANIGGESPEEATAAGRDAAIRRVGIYLAKQHTALSRREIRAVAQTIVDEAAAHDLDVALVVAVIQVESAGYHRAVSPVGALGLMQLMPATGKALALEQGVTWHGPDTLFDPVINVRLGIAYLYELSDRYEHLPTALAAYNWGPTRIDSRIRRRSQIPQIYVKQVMRALDRFDDAS